MTKETFLKQFDSIPAVFPIQGQARAALHNGLEFPTTRDERWKYTRTSSLVAATYQRNEDTITSMDAFRMANAEFHTLVFVNGRFRQDLSDTMPEGVVVHSLAGTNAAQRVPLLEKLGSQSAFKTQAFVSLNTAYFEDGAFISVAENVRIAKPIAIVNIATGQQQISNVRNLIHVGRGAEASFIHQFEGLENEGSFTNAVTEIFVEKNARADYYLFENEGMESNSLNATYAEQKRDSRFTMLTVTKSGKLVRNNIYAAITGEGCETNLLGVYFTSGKQHVDNQTFADHQQPNCTSNERYKGVMNGRSTGVFNGKIMVHRDAQKTNAFQSNQNILLSDTATINTKPELEIYADDVKCSHGCTVGQLDEEAMFYLRSRGVGKEAARQLLVQAFVADIITQIPNEVVRHDLQTFAETGG